MIQTWFADDNTKMTILTINKNIKGCADDCGSSDCNQTVGGIRPRGWFQPTGIMMVMMRMMMRMRMRMVSTSKWTIMMIYGECDQEDDDCLCAVLL